MAQSYLEQLGRKVALPDSTINEIREALDRSTTILEVSDGDDDLADRLEEFASILMDESTGEIPVEDRRIALAETLTAIARALRDL